jgi:hypothetical protein
MMKCRCGEPASIPIGGGMLMCFRCFMSAVFGLKYKLTKRKGETKGG